MKRNAKVLAFALLLIGLGFTVGYRVRETVPPKPAERIRTKEEEAEWERFSEAMAKARQLASLANQFANGHDGRLPRSLDELRTSSGAEASVFRSPFATEDGEPGFELHNAGRSLASIEASTTEPLISVTRLKDDDRRIVAFVDCHVDLMKELDFIRWRIKNGALAANKRPDPKTTEPKLQRENDAP